MFLDLTAFQILNQIDLLYFSITNHQVLGNLLYQGKRRYILEGLGSFIKLEKGNHIISQHICTAEHLRNVMKRRLLLEYLLLFR